MPFDRFQDHILFAKNSVTDCPRFTISNLNECLPIELKIDENELVFIEKKTKKFYTEYIISPILIVKNSLPVPLNLKITSQPSEHKIIPNFETQIEAQEICHINHFTSQNNLISLQIDIGEILQGRSELVLNSNYLDLNHEKKARDRMNLCNIHNNRDEAQIFLFKTANINSTNTLIFYSKGCILDETCLDLEFYPIQTSSCLNNHLEHKIKLSDTSKLYLIDDIRGIKIKAAQNGASLSNEISIKDPGQFSVAIFANDQKDIFNLGVNIDLINCGKLKIILI